METNQISPDHHSAHLPEDNKWVAAFLQFTAIVLAAGMIGISVNYFRSSPLPLIGNWSIESRLTSPSGRQLAISLAEAKALHQSQGAVFLDARPVDDYDKGHIQGAKSLPWAEAEEKVMDVVGDLPDDTRFIAYCDGDTCNLSKDLALFLESLGYTHAVVLVNGWTVWQNAGLPVEAEG
jgi:rhodanese-related sulfurtransferase